MNRDSRAFNNLLRVAGVAVLFAAQGYAANFAIMPSSITNDFRGTIVLNVTGLATGQTVAVEQYLDLNGNGTIDLGQEPLVRAFSVTDGQVPSIAGVRNLNVPGDDDGLTNGRVRIELPYPGANATLARIAGNYLVRLYDPIGGGFAPLTNSFTIAQKIYAQGVTGQVTVAGSGWPLTNAVVVMVVNDGPGLGTVADAGGNFTLYNAAGDYFLVAMRNGFVDDQSVAAVTVAAGGFLTKNVTNLAANRTISGKVSDSASGGGLPGIFIEAQTSDGLFSPAFSDSSGNFTLPATAGPWKIKVSDDSGVTQLGYLTAGNKVSVDATSGSVSNVNLSFDKATAIVYGSVKDNQGNSLSGLPIQGSDASYTHNVRADTDANGNYSLGILAGDWSIGPDSKALAAINMTGQGATVSATNGQAVRQDFTVQGATTHLRGRVVDNTGAPLGNMGLVVQIFSNQGPSGSSLSPQTSGDGSFDVGVSGGHWQIGLECGSAFARGVIGPNLDIYVVDGVDQSNLTLVALPATGQITGLVRDNNGTPFSAQIFASATVNGTNYNACGADTDASGHYQLAVCAGTWQLGVAGDLTSRGYDNPANQTATVSGSNVIANITIYPLGQTPPAIVQAGYVNGHFQFRLNGDVDGKYRIEVSTNLNNPASWVVVGTNTASGGGFDFVDTNSPPVPARFYRAVLVP